MNHAVNSVVCILFAIVVQPSQGFSQTDVDSDCPRESQSTLKERSIDLSASGCNFTCVTKQVDANHTATECSGAPQKGQTCEAKKIDTEIAAAISSVKPCTSDKK